MPKVGKNIYKRRDGRWEGRYIKDRDVSGKIIYGSVYGKTCADVKHRLSLAEDCTLNSLGSIDAIKYDLTFAEIAAKWLPVISLKVKQSTHAGYLTTLNAHVLPMLGDYKIQNINSTIIGHFAMEKLEKGRFDCSGGLSSKTVRDILSIIKSVMDFAWNEKYIANRITISYPKHEQQTIRVLTRYEQSALEAVLKTDLTIHKVGMLLCLYTGIRVGELCALRWQDISPMYDILFIRQTLQRIKNTDENGRKTKIHIDSPKSLCSERSIPLPKFLSLILRDFATDNRAYILSTEDSDFTEPRTMQNHFARAAKAANIADVNYHALRHTFATRCIEAGVDVKSLSEILGHANVNITLNRYVHPSFEHKRLGIDKLEQYIGK